MVIGQRLRDLREAKDLSQGDIEVRTGLLRCYTSRVENGYTVPSLETLEKYARALEIPMYHLMYDGEDTLEVPKSADGDRADSWESSPVGVRLMRKLIPLLARMSQPDRDLILCLAGKASQMARRNEQKRKRSASGTQRQLV